VDVLHIIFQYTEIPTLFRLRSVCKSWKEYLLRESFWKEKCLRTWTTLSLVTPQFNTNLPNWQSLFRIRYERDSYIQRITSKNLNRFKTFQSRDSLIALINELKTICHFGSVAGYALNEKNDFSPEVKFLAEGILYSDILTAEKEKEYDVNDKYPEKFENNVTGTLMDMQGNTIPFSFNHTEVNISLGDETYPLSYNMDVGKWLSDFASTLHLKDWNPLDLYKFIKNYLITKESFESDSLEEISGNLTNWETETKEAYEQELEDQ